LAVVAYRSSLLYRLSSVQLTFRHSNTVFTMPPKRGRSLTDLRIDDSDPLSLNTDVQCAKKKRPSYNISKRKKHHNRPNQSQPNQQNTLNKQASTQPGTTSSSVSCRRQQQQQSTSGFIDDVLDAVASQRSATVQLQPSSHSSKTDSCGLGKIVTDVKTLSDTVSKCMATVIAPISEDVHDLQRVLLELRAVVEALSLQVNHLSHLSQTMPKTTSKPSNMSATNPPPNSSADSQINLRHDTSSWRGGQRAEHQNAQQSQQSQQSQDVRQDAVAEMYIDLNRKQRRANNIVVSGLPTATSESKAVHDLLLSEFDYDWTLNIVNCRRIGKPQPNKVHPLLVSFESPETAEYFIKRAKWLRDSKNPTVRKNVYINANYTPSEAKAAYELRQRRRQRTEQRNQSEQQTESESSGHRERTFYKARVPATTEAKPQ